MNLIPPSTPKTIKILYPEYIWDFYNTKEKTIYLTFDDGPIPEVTPFVLHLLDQFNAKATFFCIGENIEKYPELFRRVMDAGHSLGNHTNNHLKAWKCTDEEYIHNTVAVERLLHPYIQTNDKLFRPPYGQISKSKCTKLIEKGYKIVMWDVLSKDWEAKNNPEKCAENVINNTRSGSIVVFHDSIKAYKNLSYALPKVLEHFSRLEYTFSRI